MPIHIKVNVKTNKKISKSFFYIPVQKQLTCILSNRDYVEQVLEETPESVSEFIRKNDMVNTIRIIIYSDDFGCTNPIGPSKNKHKIFATYLDVENFVLWQSSDLRALIFAYRSTVTAAGGVDVILEPLVNDMKKLISCGIQTTRKDGSDIILQVRLCFVIGDNLGRNELLGFTQNFGLYFICSYCSVNYQEMKLFQFNPSRTFNVNRNQTE